MYPNHKALPKQSATSSQRPTQKRLICRTLLGEQTTKMTLTSQLPQTISAQQM
jgi:hypothetical protein